MPDVPTIAETVPGYEFIGWYSLVRAGEDAGGASSTSSTREIGEDRCSTPEFRERFSALGAEPSASTQQELAAYLRVQTEKMRKAVKDSGARPD